MVMAAQARGFGVQIGVLRALLVREALGRFGHENLGFFWVILEPLMFALGVTILWTLARMTHGSVSTVTFVLTGYTLLTMFRHITVASIRQLRRNLGVRFHAIVKPLDIVVAQSMLVALGCLAAFYVAYLPLTVLGIMEPMRDPLLAMGAFALCAWFCFGFGLILAALSEMNDVLERVLPVTMYLTLPLTGVFTMQAWLPAKARDILAWSPFVNIMEMLRAGMFSEDVVTMFDVQYVLWFCFAQTVLGFVLFDYVKKRVDMD
jgi:capsular polysaccharide transport system permease protein